MIDVPEIVLVVAAVLLQIGYHLFLRYEIRRHPQRTMIGMARRQRVDWIDRIIVRDDGILAVQTLRNWGMSSSFLASTAILIAVGLLGFVISTDGVSRLVHGLNLLGSYGDVFTTLKLVLLIVNFLLAFFNFTLSIRYYNYAAFAVIVVGEAKTTAIGYLERGATHYTLGMRGYYFAVPLALWLFGPLWLLAASLAIIAALYQHDHSPS